MDSFVPLDARKNEDHFQPKILCFGKLLHEHNDYSYTPLLFRIDRQMNLITYPDELRFKLSIPHLQ